MIDLNSRLASLTGAGSGSQLTVLRPYAKPVAVEATHVQTLPGDYSKEVTPKVDFTTAVSQLNKQLQQVQSNLQFSIDEASGHIVIKIVNTQTDEVIRQVPSEVVLALAENAEKSGGMVVDEMV